MSIHGPIIRRWLSHPRRVVALDDRRSYRGVEMLAASFALAEHLATRCQTQTLGVMMPSSGVFSIAAMAGWILGKTVVPLNFLLKGDDLRYVIRDCGTDTIVTAQPLLDAMGATPRIKTLVRFEDVRFGGVPEPRWPAPARDDDLALILYTSGTSGLPKGVMLTHGNITANVRQVVDWVEFTPKDVLLGVLPQFHSFGLTVLTLLPLSAGCRVVYAARFVPHRIVRLFREQRPTAFIGIPSMYNALLHAKDARPEDFASLRFAVSGGEPLPDAVAEGFYDRFGVRINEGYGLTETAPVANWCRPFEFKPHSVGRALPGVVERIVDIDTGRDLPVGRDGEVRIAGPNVMKGYYKLPAQTAEAFDERGFFRTGDMGRFDRDGHLSITGRIKEMLIIGGENVFPREIEEVLNRHPAIADSGVIGADDPIRGEVPVAFVELVEAAEADERELVTHCREHLPGYKAPRTVRIVTSLPRGPTGKVLRRELHTLL